MKYKILSHQKNSLKSTLEMKTQISYLKKLLQKKMVELSINSSQQANSIA